MGLSFNPMQILLCISDWDGRVRSCIEFSTQSRECYRSIADVFHIILPSFSLITAYTQEDNCTNKQK